MTYSTKQKHNDHNKCIRFAKKVECINFLGGSCKHCGTTDIHVLDFHHIDMLEKDNTISRLLKSSWDNLKVELQKCILLCANCHRKLHTDINFYNINSDKINEMVKTGIFVIKKITDEELITLIRKGLSQRGIARKYKMAKTTIQFRIRQLLEKGLIKEHETTTMKGWDPSRKSITKVTDEMILPKLNSGEYIKSIAEYYDVHFKTIYVKAKRLRERGLWIPTENQRRFLTSLA